MKPSSRIASLLALAAAALVVSPVGASAQTMPGPLAPHVNEPIATTEGLAIPSIGNGAIAWAALDHPFGTNAPGTAIWTLRAGGPALVAHLPRLRARRLEAGMDASGNPVAIVSAFPRHGLATPFYLVRLDDGAVQRLRMRAHARFVNAVAIDAGRVFYSTSLSLWTARLNGSRLIAHARLRTSRRGETFETVRADRKRIAVGGKRLLPKNPEGLDVQLPLYAGTARGTWRKVGSGGGSEGGTLFVEAAGFTRDGRSVIVTRANSAHEEFSVQRVSLRSGRTKNLFGGAVPEIAGAYDPVSNRLLLSSYFMSGYQLGWSSVLG